MIYIIAAFRSRNQAMAYSQILSSYNVKNNIINTPRKVSVSCGLSVKFFKQNFEVAKEILSRRRFDTFAGFYLVDTKDADYNISPIF